MKRIAITLGLIGALAAGGAAQAAGTTLAYGSPAGPDGPEAQAVANFAERVAADTNGEVAFDSTYSGSVVNWGTSLTGVRDGLVDGTFLTPAFNPSEMKATFVFIRLASAPGNLDARTAAVAETALLNCPQCRAEWKRFNITPLMFSGSDPFKLMCKPDVSSLDKIQGKSIRGAGPFANYAQDMGGIPTTIVPSELFEALQRGQVDCALGGVGWLRQFGLGDIVEHVVDESLGYDHVRMPLVVNTDFWEDLSVGHREAFLNNLAFLHAEANAINTAYAEEAVADADAKGVALIPMADDLKAATQEHREKVYDTVVADAAEHGVADAEQLVADYQAALEKWNGITAEIGDDRAKYEEALHREIYSKLQ